MDIAILVFSDNTGISNQTTALATLYKPPIREWVVGKFIFLWARSVLPADDTLYLPELLRRNHCSVSAGLIVNP